MRDELTRGDAVHGGYLPTLDGWRAVAIAMVLVAHAGTYLFSPIGSHPSGRLQTYAVRGGAGVDVFFAISGFLICSRLLREHQTTGSINLRTFYVRRAFRILPPYLLYLAVIAVIAAAGKILVTRAEWISCLLFVRNYLPAVRTRDIGWYTGHFWSLAVEEHFYLLWPGLLAMAGPKRAWKWAAAVIAVVVVWRAIDLHTSLLSRYLGETIAHRTDTRLDALLWGCLFAFAYRAEGARERLKRWLGVTTWMVCAAALVVCVSKENAVTMALAAPLFAAVVVGTVLRPQWALGRVLENRVLRWIGRMSYSIYIWQQLFLVSELVPRPLPLGRAQVMPWSFAAILACAAGSYYGVERPLIRLGHRIGGSGRQRESRVS